MSGVIDFHAHILPNADHGSDGLQTSLDQLKLLHNTGVDTVVATPHFYPHRHTCASFAEKITASCDTLSQRDGTAPNICLGAEVLYCDGIDHMEDLDGLCIKGTDLLLLELPTDVWERSLFDTVKQLTKKYRVVLAHIDRYVHKQSEEIDFLLEMGALAQINASSLFSFSTKRKLKPYIEEGLIVALGTDLHGADKKACKYFADADKKLGDEYFEIMKRTNALLEEALHI